MQSHGDKDMIKQMKGLQRKRESCFVHDAHIPIAPSIKKKLLQISLWSELQRRPPLTLKWGELPLAVKRIGSTHGVTYLHLTSVCTIALRHWGIILLFCFISVRTRELDLKHLSEHPGCMETVLPNVRCCAQLCTWGSKCCATFEKLKTIWESESDTRNGIPS